MSLHADQAVDSPLLFFQLVELASVSLMDTKSVAFDVVGCRSSLVVEDAAVSVLDELLIHS